MDLQAEKLSLVQAILDIEDISLIKKVKKIIKKADHDWFDDLTEEQQQDVIIGLEQADRGETITHEEAIARLGL
jgi:predicted transcriptional regulator